MKFYAVRVGRKPGIYHTWADCLNQVRGFPKSIFKSFPTPTEAQRFLDGDDANNVCGVGGTATGKPPKFYAVRSGRHPGVYTTWGEVLDQITGWKAPKHRVFKTRTEAELYLQEGQNSGFSYPDSVVDGTMDSIEHTDQMGPAQKKAKTASKGKRTIKDEYMDGVDGFGEYDPGDAPLGPEVEDGFDNSLTIDPRTNDLRYRTGSERTKTKYMAARPVPEAPIRIYTDGSSLSNGRESAIGGVGVYFGPQDGRNVSESLAGLRQTNQRAELTAIIRALDIAPKDRKLVILSDSNYAIKCTNEWYQKWRVENKWVTAAGKPVENRDLIQKIIDNLEQRYRINKHRDEPYGEEDDKVDPDDPANPGPWERGVAGVKFVWVKGHAKDEGNTAADYLATAGAREARFLANEFGSLVEASGMDF